MPKLPDKELKRLEKSLTKVIYKAMSECKGIFISEYAAASAKAIIKRLKRKKLI